MLTLEKKLPYAVPESRMDRGFELLDYQRLETVLLIEDDLELNDLIAKRFRRAGFVVARAYDGASGLDMIRRVRPDALILDLGLPRMDGAKILHHLRVDPGVPSIPVFVITGSSNGALIRKALHWGVTQVMRKPVSPHSLVQAIVDSLDGV